jgi:hypothetical protein
MIRRLWLVTWLLAGLAGGVAEATAQAAVGQPAPSLEGGPWINSGSLTPAALRGRVVFIEFWTYG